MNRLILASLVVTALYFSIPQSLQTEGDLTDMTFKQFKSKFNKVYSSPQEESQRKKIFQDNIQFIKKMNDREVWSIMRVNNFADVERDEFLQKYVQAPNEFEDLEEYVDQGESKWDYKVDWRDDKIILKVKKSRCCCR